MTRIAGALFDKDGTLFDFAATWGAWCRTIIAAEAQGDVTLAARLAIVLGYDLVTGVFAADSIVIGHTTGEVAEAILPLLPHTTFAALLERLNAAGVMAPQAPAADLPALVADLRARGLRLGVATNDSEAPARAHLAHAGVGNSFDFIAGYDSGFGGKPAPGQLLAFAESFGLDPAACIMVGDSLHDLHAAKAAGMIPVAVLTGIAKADVLAPHAAVVLQSVADLPAWIDAQA